MADVEIEVILGPLSNLEKKTIKKIKFNKNAKTLVKKFVHKVLKQY